jgi:Uma2 family endonuclease
MGRKIEAMNPEVIESPLSSEELAVRYRALCDDPLYAKVPGKIEVDVWGRVLMSPPASSYHSALQIRLSQRLAVLGGEMFAELGIVTPAGILVTDVAWASSGFMRLHAFETPYTKAPELCIEVVSPSNSVRELEEKRIAYLAAGAHEVWIVYPQSKRFEFHGRQGPIPRSAYAVDLTGLFDQRS